MDTLAHGLWGGAVFGQRKESRWKWAFGLGMAPDLLSFGPFFLTRIGDIGERWANHRFGPPDPSIIPAYVYHAYNVTHSLVVWAGLFALCYGVSACRSIGVSAKQLSGATPKRPHAHTPIRTLWPL